MKMKPKFPSVDKIKDYLGRYKYVLVVVLAGVILLTMPTGNDNKAPTCVEGISGEEEDFSINALEDKIEAILSEMEGVGKVTVMLTVRTGMERILAAEREVQEGTDKQNIQESPLVISSDAGDEVVLIGQNYPTFQGALVVCEGGDDPAIQLKIVQALSSLTGLSSGRITVCKGK